MSRPFTVLLLFALARSTARSTSLITSLLNASAASPPRFTFFFFAYSRTLLFTTSTSAFAIFETLLKIIRKASFKSYFSGIPRLSIAAPVRNFLSASGSSLIFTRTCCIESRSRIVTVLSSSVLWSTVIERGTPISSILL